MALFQIVYSSASTTPGNREAVLKILDESIKNNPANGITGMLLAVDDCYLQVLEGEENDVRRLFSKILVDYRHQKIVKLYEKPIEHRYFREWSMGYAELSAPEVYTLPGCNNFFQSGKTLSDLEESTAKKIIKGFRDGKWRQRLT